MQNKSLKMAGKNQALTFQESVRMRPWMFMGTDGIVGLIAGLFNDSVENL